MPQCPWLRVLAEADIGHDEDSIDLVFKQPDGSLDNPVIRVTFRSPLVLAVGDAKEDHRRDSE